MEGLAWKGMSVHSFRDLCLLF